MAKFMNQLLLSSEVAHAVADTLLANCNVLEARLKALSEHSPKRKGMQDVYDKAHMTYMAFTSAYANSTSVPVPSNFKN